MASQGPSPIGSPNVRLDDTSARIGDGAALQIIQILAVPIHDLRHDLSDRHLALRAQLIKRGSECEAESKTSHQNPRRFLAARMDTAQFGQHHFGAVNTSRHELLTIEGQVVVIATAAELEQGTIDRCAAELFERFHVR